MSRIAAALSIFGAVMGLVMFALAIVGIWTGDARWGYTAFAFGMVAFFALMLMIGQ